MGKYSNHPDAFVRKFGLGSYVTYTQAKTFLQSYLTKLLSYPFKVEAQHRRMRIYVDYNGNRFECRLDYYPKERSFRLNYISAPREMQNVDMSRISDPELKKINLLGVNIPSDFRTRHDCDTLGKLINDSISNYLNDYKKIESALKVESFVSFTSLSMIQSTLEDISETQDIDSPIFYNEERRSIEKNKLKGNNHCFYFHKLEYDMELTYGSDVFDCKDYWKRKDNNDAFVPSDDIDQPYDKQVIFVVAGENLYDGEKYVGMCYSFGLLPLTPEEYDKMTKPQEITDVYKEKLSGWDWTNNTRIVGYVRLGYHVFVADVWKDSSKMMDDVEIFKTKIEKCMDKMAAWRK